MSEDNDVIASGYALFRQKVASHEERLTHHLDHAVSRSIAIDVLRLVLGSQVEASAGPGAKVLEHRVLLLPVEKVACSDSIVKALDFRPDHHELIGLRIGHRSQERCIIDGKNGRVGADADGQREQNRERQAGVSGKHTEAEPDVLKKILHSCLPW